MFALDVREQKIKQYLQKEERDKAKEEGTDLLEKGCRVMEALSRT